MGRGFVARGLGLLGLGAGAVDQEHAQPMRSPTHVKHIITKHDGEARLVGDDDGWIPFPVSDGGLYPGVNTSIRQACFWHYQFATNPQVRFFLHQRSQEKWAEEDLGSSDIQWMMERQNNENTLLKWQWSLDSASGGWWIRKGNYITLPEVLAPFRRSTFTAPMSRSPCSSSTGTIPFRKLLGRRNVADIDDRASGGKLA